MADSDANPTFFAILIGINDYVSKPLQGCVNDVKEIRRYFSTLDPPVQSRLLTGTGSSNTDDPYQQRPTFAAVKAAFQETSSSARPGDFVYIHFAGHGTRVQTSDLFANQNAGDLALVLLDHEAENEEQYLIGAELASWLKDMVDKGLVVTLVLDCCFAASVYRYDDSDVRYLPPTSEAIRRFQADFRQNTMLQHTGPIMRDSSMLPNWLIDPDRYAVLVASGPDQEAKELQTSDGQHHGILSFLLLMTWQRNGGTKTKHRIVYHHLCAESRKHRFTQHPVLYGNKEQGFFGVQPSALDTVPIVIHKTQDRKLVMQAGQAHGVCVGDEFTIARTDILSVRSSEALAASVVAKVSQVRGLTSDLEVTDIDLVPDRGILAAEVYNKASFRHVRVVVADSLPVMTELIGALQARSFNLESDSQDTEPDFCVSVDIHGHCILSIKSRRSVIDLDETIPEPVDAAAISNAIEHLTNYEALWHLSHKDVTDAMCTDVNVHINHKGGRISTDEAVTMISGDVCELMVENTADQDIFVFAYALGPDWQVENLLRGTYEVVPSPNLQRGLTGLLRKKLRMTVSPAMIARGISECEDMIKVIVTFRPACFDLLELSKLGLPRKSTTDFMRNGQEGDSWTSEEWMAFTFRICTICTDYR